MTNLILKGLHCHLNHSHTCYRLSLSAATGRKCDFLHHRFWMSERQPRRQLAALTNSFKGRSASAGGWDWVETALAWRPFVPFTAPECAATAKRPVKKLSEHFRRRNNRNTEARTAVFPLFAVFSSLGKPFQLRGEFLIAKTNRIASLGKQLGSRAAVPLFSSLNDGGLAVYRL